jgi:hypothetical protein
MTHVPIEALQTSLVKLNRGMAEANAGKNKDLASLFAHLHIPLHDAHGQITSLADAMPRLADAFLHTEDPALRSRMAMVLFGRQGMEMIPILEKGKAGLAGYAQYMKGVSYSLTPKQEQELKDFDNSWGRLEAAIGGFKKEVAANLAPVLTPLLDSMKDFVIANRHWMSTLIAGRVKAIGDALSRINITGLITQISDTIDGFIEVAKQADKFGGVMTVMAATISIPFIASLFVVASGIRAISLAMVGNPAIAAALVLAGAFYLMYYNWALFSDYFQKGLESIKQGFRDLEKLVPHIPRFWTTPEPGDAPYNDTGLPGVDDVRPRRAPQPAPPIMAYPPVLGDDNYVHKPWAPSPLQPTKRSGWDGSGSGESVTDHYQSTVPAPPAQVVVKFENAPKGMRATLAKGQPRAPKVDLGINYGPMIADFEH